MKIYLVLYFNDNYYDDDCASKAVLYDSTDVLAFTSLEEAQKAMNSLNEEEGWEDHEPYHILTVDVQEKYVAS